MAKGKWAQGIKPRNFRWVLKDQLAVCERPGGYGENHRKVRREEEIIWIKMQEFSCVISLIPSPHNLHNYEEHEVVFQHRPLATHTELNTYLADLYPELKRQIEDGGRLLVHREELGEQLAGLMAGFLLWLGRVPSGPMAISIADRLFERSLGPRAREIVAAAGSLPGAAGT